MSFERNRGSSLPQRPVETQKDQKDTSGIEECTQLIDRGIHLEPPILTSNNTDSLIQLYTYLPSFSLCLIVSLTVLFLVSLAIFVKQSSFTAKILNADSQTISPTQSPSKIPTCFPTRDRSPSPLFSPTPAPSQDPISNPSSHPTDIPSATPTNQLPIASKKDAIAPRYPVNLAPYGYTNVTTSILQSSYGAPLYDQSKKMVFCWIPKNSCSKIKAMFEVMIGEALNVTVSTKEIHNHKLHRFQQVKGAKYSQMFEDRNWNKIVFIRDPVQRLESGFMDKCKRKYKYGVCGKIKTFKEFVDALHEAWNRENPCDVSDSSINMHHFRPQFCWCDLWKDGVQNYHVYSFNSTTRDQQISTFLGDYGLEKYAFIFNSSSGHANTNSREELDKILYGSDKEQIQNKIKDMLRLDYDMFF